MYRIVGADQNEYGPISLEQLRLWLAEGRVNAQTKVRVEGAADWKPLGTLPEFSLLLGIQPLPGGRSLNPPLPPAPQRTNPFALTGMVMGLISITIGCCCCYGLPFNVLGIVCSLIGLAQIQSSPDLYSGKALAITGLILSLVSIALAGLMMILWLALGSGEILRDMKNFS